MAIDFKHPQWVELSPIWKKIDDCTRLRNLDDYIPTLNPGDLSVDNGDRIRLTAEGEAGESGAPAGDLFVQMHIKPHPIFERDNADLFCEVPISIVIAALGGELEVPSLNGRLNLKVPPGTQTHKSFRMRGKGIKPVRGGAVGDLICRIIVETPVKLNNEQKELLEKLAKSMDKGGVTKHSPNEKSWLDGMKTFFEEMKS